MANIGRVLKSEIIRLARKELRAQVEPLRKANAGYRRDIAELKRKKALLERHLKVAAKPQPKLVTDTEDVATATRYSARVTPLRG